MAILHRIQLRGPWEFAFLTPPDQVELSTGVGRRERARRIHMPATWSAAVEKMGKSVAGEEMVRFIRPFHRPTGVAEEQVWLVIAGLTASAEIKLNGEFLGRAERDAPAAEFDISSRLKPRNMLEIRVSVVCDAAARTDRLIWESVVLEMRAANLG